MVMTLPVGVRVRSCQVRSSPLVFGDCVCVCVCVCVCGRGLKTLLLTTLWGLILSCMKGGSKGQLSGSGELWVGQSRCRRHHSSCHSHEHGGSRYRKLCYFVHFHLKLNVRWCQHILSLLTHSHTQTLFMSYLRISMDSPLSHSLPLTMYGLEWHM